jgi:hypothetical protein
MASIAEQLHERSESLAQRGPMSALARCFTSLRPPPLQLAAEPSREVPAREREGE